MRARRVPKYKAKKVHLRNHNTCFSRVRPDHPRCRGATWICLCGHTHDMVIYSKFHRNSFRGFGAPGGSKFGLSHYFGYCLLQQLVQAYTSRDTCVCTLRGEFRDFVGNGTIDRQTQTVGMLILAKVIRDTA